MTTLQIAHAAGISEPTIFRAFADKNDVPAACLADVSDPRHVVAELDAIEPALPLPERLVALIDVIRAQGERTGAVVNAVSLAGQGRQRNRDPLSDEDRTRLSENRTASCARSACSPSPSRPGWARWRAARSTTPSWAGSPG